MQTKLKHIVKNIESDCCISVSFLIDVCLFFKSVSLFQVDSSKKLAGYCGISAKDSRGCNCAIVIRDTSVTPSSPEDESEPPPLSKTEQILTDFYVGTLKVFPRPIIQLLTT